MSKLTIGVFFFCITFIQEAKLSVTYRLSQQIQSVSSARTCSIDADLVPIDQSTKDTVLDTINRLRNFVASGSLEGFSSASQMSTVTWDDELSELAAENVFECHLHRDSVKTLGQSIGYHHSRTAEPSMRDTAIRQIKSWFHEHELASMRNIMYNDIPKDRAPYNFLQLVYEQMTKVGCAAVKQTKSRYYQIFFTCNYNKAPGRGALVYNTGKTPGEGCRNNLSKTYKSLCDSNNVDDRGDQANNTTTPPPTSSKAPETISPIKTEIERWKIKTETFMKTMDMMLKKLEDEEIDISTFNLPYFPTSSRDDEY